MRLYLRLIFCFFVFCSFFSTMQAGVQTIQYKDLLNKQPINKAFPMYKVNKKAAFAQLNSVAKFTMLDFPVSEYSFVNLDLERTVNVVDANTIFLKGGDDKPLEHPIVNTFIGTIAGQNNTEAFLVQVGDYMFGKVKDANGRVAIIAPSKNAESHTLIKESELLSMSQAQAFFNTEDTPRDLEFEIEKHTDHLLSSKLLEIEIALETDTEFYNATGKDVKKAQAYAIAVFTLVSKIYKENINVSIKLPWVKIWTDSPADPYESKQTYNITLAAKDYWKQNYTDVERDLAHVMSAGGNGGYSYFNALCTKAGHGIGSSSPFGTLNLPTFAYTYDVYIVAHEIGHNFNGRHTHSCYWNTPIDSCVVAQGIEEGCLKSDTKKVPNLGTIMSYCPNTNADFGKPRTCEMKFHQKNIEIMRAYAEKSSCLTSPDQAIVDLVAPIGEEHLRAGEDLDIEWMSSKVSTIKLSYSSDNGNNWKLIAENVNAADKKYTWKLPDMCSNKMRVKIEDQSNPEVKAENIKSFTIAKDSEDNLVSYYPFNGNAKDEICGFNDGTVSGAKLTEDRHDNENSAYLFDGKSNIVAKDYPSDYKHISISFWFNASKLQGRQTLLGHNWQKSASFLTSVWDKSLGVFFWLDGKSAPIEVWTPNISSNRWYHVVMMYDGKAASLYLNGEKKKTVEYSSRVSKSTTDLFVGSRGNTEYFNGSVDDIKIFSKALMLEDIIKLFKEGVVDLEKPQLISPADKATDQEFNIDFSWERVTDADSYHIIVAKDKQFSKGNIVAINIQKTDTNYEKKGFQELTTYYWKVAGLKGMIYSDWSDVYSFTTKKSSSVDDTQQEDISIHPNPVKDYLYIQNLGSAAYIEVFDNYGQKIMAFKTPQCQIDCRDLTNGVYYLIIKRNKELLKKRFVVNK